MELIDETLLFQNNKIRVYGNLEEPWFLAKDICNILNITNTTETLRNFPTKWKKLQKIETSHKNLVNTYLISEPGLYRLLMRSNKEIAEKFQEWVCEDILPSIRKRGKYIVEQEHKEQLNKIQLTLYEKEKEIERLTRLEVRRFRQRFPSGNCIYILGHEKFKNQYKIGSTKNFNDRINGYSTGSPTEYDIIYHRLIYDMENIEALVKHCLFKYKTPLRNEWFEVDDVNIIIDTVNKFCDLVDDYKPQSQLVKPIVPVHIVQNTVNTKLKNPLLLPQKPCNICNIVKPLEEYFNAKEHRDGKENVCKVCVKIRQEKHLQKLRETTEIPVEKECTECNEMLSINDYYKDKYSPDGHSRKCKVCIKNYQKSPKDVKIITEKACGICKKIKPIEEYHKNKRSVDGHKHECKECLKIKARERYYKNQEKKEQKRQNRLRKKSEESDTVDIDEDEYVYVDDIE
jgi:prophage antirepressor-like protein